jgi:hypothetical protein
VLQKIDISLSLAMTFYPDIVACTCKQLLPDIGHIWQKLFTCTNNYFWIRRWKDVMEKKDIISQRIGVTGSTYAPPLTMKKLYTSDICGLCTPPVTITAQVAERPLRRIATSGPWEIGKNKPPNHHLLYKQQAFSNGE